MKTLTRTVGLVAAVLILVIGIGLALLPRLVETAWAGEQVRAAIEKSSGREVEIGEMTFSWMDGLRVHDVVVHQRRGGDAAHGPLVRLETLALDVSFADLLRRRLRVDELAVTAPSIVIVRHGDGSFNISDLLERPAESAPGSEQPGALRSVRVPLRIDDAKVRYIDRVADTEVTLARADIDGRWDDGKLRLSAEGLLNDGDFAAELSADLSRTPSPFRIERFSIDGAKLTTQARLLARFFPLLAGELESAGGRLTFVLEDLTASGYSMASLRRSLSGKGQLKLDDANIESKVVAGLFQALRTAPSGDWRALARSLGEDEGTLALGTVDVPFAVHRGTVEVQPITLAAKEARLTLAGTTTLTGALDYEITVGGIDRVLGEGGELPLTLSGNLRRPEVGLDRRELIDDAARRVLPKALDELDPPVRQKARDLLDRVRGG